MAEKASRPEYLGTCLLCGGKFKSSGLSTHLRGCLPKHPVGGPPPLRKTGAAKHYHVGVKGLYQPEYWLHLEVAGNCRLGELDQFLRDFWLECCGHLSGFEIEGDSYDFTPLGADENWMGQQLGDPKISSVLQPGMVIRYQYDFGSTTELEIRVVGVQTGGRMPEPLRILAQNDPPDIRCDKCGQPATQVCTECLWDGTGWLCDKCAKKHRCGEEMLLPVVNSPRVGVCGYTG